MSDSSVWEEEQSVLAISVPEANGILDYVRSRYKGDIPLVGVPAHITLLYPWMPPGRIDETILAELATVFAGYPAFEFTLDLGVWARGAITGSQGSNSLYRYYESDYA